MAASVSPSPRGAKPTVVPAGAETRARLLDAAERIFAQKGFNGASLREIIAAAKVNIAAAHYHFGSKEGLFEAAFERCAEPVRHLTMQMLDAAEQWRGRPEYLEQILRAVLVPTLAEGPGRPRVGKAYGRLRAHIFLEDQAFARRLFRKIYADMERRTVEALGRALPDLPRQDLAWRFHVLLATVVFSTVPSGRVHTRSSFGSYEPNDPKEAVQYLVPLMVAAFRAPEVGIQSGSTTPE
jgi:AcrR family transcriptional regulator